MSQFIQGKIKNSKFEGGNTKILLERKDESEFVAIIDGHEAFKKGDTFRRNGFSKAGSVNGRDIYNCASLNVQGSSEKDTERATPLRTEPVKDIPKDSLVDVMDIYLEFDVALQVEMAALNAAVVATSTTGLPIDELWPIYANKIITNARLRENNAHAVIAKIEEQTK